MDKAEILIFVPRPEEYEAVKELQETEFQNFAIRAILTGSGKINTAAAVAAEAVGPRRPALLIGAGLCGSLHMKLSAGEAVVSDSAAIGDWMMEDDQLHTYGPYGGSSYQTLEGGQGEALAIKGRNRWVDELLVRLGSKGFRRGRLLTTDTYIAGPGGKLARGRLWGAAACDHESGALALVASERLPETPWLNIRVVADTIGEQMGAEGRAVNLMEILALKLLVLLSTIDKNFPKCDCARAAPWTLGCFASCPQ